MNEDALSLKEKGNVEFKKGEFLKAAGLYTKAIKLDPENAVLYSNRCAALTKLNKVNKAIADADKCIELKPEWDKGYFRKACIYENLDDIEESLTWYKKSYDKNNENQEISYKIRMLEKILKNKKKKNSVKEKN